jgi:hypothetical protein
MFLNLADFPFTGCPPWHKLTRFIFRQVPEAPPCVSFKKP